MSALWYFHHSQGSNCCVTPSAAAKHVGNSDFIPSMASESKHGKADSELRSLLVAANHRLVSRNFFAYFRSICSLVVFPSARCLATAVTYIWMMTCNYVAV